MVETLQPGLILAGVGRFAIAFRIDIAIAASGFGLAVLLGGVVAAMMRARSRLIRALAFIYVLTVRGVPMFVLLYWVYFGLASALSLPLTSLKAALIALTLGGSGYTAEVLRTGLESIDAGQFDAARALGLESLHLYADVVLPQALRRVIPPLASVFVIMVQWATLVSVISVPDMLFVAHRSILQNFRIFDAYVAVVIVMVVAVTLLSSLVALLERRLGARP